MFSSRTDTIEIDRKPEVMKTKNVQLMNTEEMNKLNITPILKMIKENDSKPEEKEKSKDVYGKLEEKEKSKDEHEKPEEKDESKDVNENFDEKEEKKFESVKNVENESEPEEENSKDEPEIIKKSKTPLEDVDQERITQENLTFSPRNHHTNAIKNT